MKKLLMSVAFIALVGSIVPADAGSTFSIGGGLNLGHVQTGTGAASTGTAAAGSLASGTNTNIGAGFAAATPARRHLDRGWSVCGAEQRRERRGLVRQRRGHHWRRLQQYRYRCRRRLHQRVAIT